ncbi:MAG: outer membrane lipoprotein-sorting protein [Deltaproteobacteria bacterium]|nr:outer membrane lipoprotein-sorting protein [Deltaproteobacteria bacterium]
MKNLKMIVMCGLFLSLTAGEISAYVMPLEQILARVRKRFAAQYSLIIEQATHVIQSRDPLIEEVFGEKVWLKNPRYERTMEMNTLAIQNAKMGGSKIIPANATENQASEDQPDQAFRQPNQDASYRWLLMDNPKGGISAYLSQLGIQIWDLGYDRCDGVVAYRVGNRDPQSPRLLVDKERFFPLLLSYMLPGDPQGRLVTVRFKDYRKSDAGWYPYEIEYELEGAPLEVYDILNLTANAPIETSFFEMKVEPPPTPVRPSPNQGQPDDDHLREIMRKLEKKYQ